MESMHIMHSVRKHIYALLNDNPNEGGVRIFMPDDDCDSEDPGDEWEYVGTGKAGAKAAAAEAEKAKEEAAARAAVRRCGR